MSTSKTTTTEVKSLPAQAGQKSLKSKAGEKLIIGPRVTEKASMQSSANVYTFVVERNATKHNLLEEIKKEYKVTPTSINIINLPRRKVFIRGKFGFQTGVKKAVVFLKKGDTIKLA